jgi:hypothetical protein
MAKKIQMWKELGPQLAPATPVEPEEVVEELVLTTNQTRGSLLAVLSELDTVLLSAQGRAARQAAQRHHLSPGGQKGRLDQRQSAL